MNYGSVNDADTYFLTQRVYSPAWEQATPEQKQAALNHATRIIDTLNYEGTKNSTLEFPRGADTEVPTEVIYACYEIAYNLVDGRDPDFEIENLGQDAASIGGGGRVTKNAKMTPLHIVHGVPSETAWRLLSPFLRSGQEITISRS